MTAAPDVPAMPALEDWLRGYLAESRPQSVLLLCNAGVPRPLVELAGILAGLHIDHRRNVQGIADLDGVGRFDVALLLRQMEGMTRQRGQPLLARLRDLHAVRVCVALREAHQVEWRDNDWRALGFMPAGRALEGGQCVRLFTYDLATYNPGRTWNTADNWAHPSNFERFRW